jgi:septal ring factor EnvC (AmiA/AmiB activator)
MNAYARIIIILLLVPALSFSQSKKDLEKKKQALQKEISNTNSMLEQTRKNKRKSLNQLVVLNNKISKREEVIKTIGSEVKVIDDQISGNEREIARLESELGRLKAEYAGMIYVAWKNRSAYDKLMFLFSSSDFNQAYKRMKYFQQYSENRHRQAALIDSTKAKISGRNKELSQTKQSKSELLSSQEKEKQKLTKEKAEKEEVLTDLQKKEKQLKADLKKKKKDADQLTAAIKRVIEEEVRKSREEAMKAARKEEAERKKKEEKKEGGSKEKPVEKPKKTEPEPAKETYRLVLTPEAERLGNSFEANRSKLPWPVAEGVITGAFGEHDHPVLKGIKVKNNGIDIATRSGATTRAVYDGVVSGVVSIPGAGQAVIIRHGEYLTVYSNMASVSVSRGDKVKTKQQIGTVLSDDEKTELHFELWKGSLLLNPAMWLRQ